MLTVFFFHIVFVYLTSSYKVAIRNDRSTNGDESSMFIYKNVESRKSDGPDRNR